LRLEPRRRASQRESGAHHAGRQARDKNRHRRPFERHAPPRAGDAHGLYHRPDRRPERDGSDRNHPRARGLQIRVSSSAIVHALLSVKTCTAELYLNDVPISRLTPAGLAAEGRAIEQYLIPGTNRIELLVEPGERPSQTRSGTRMMTLENAEASALI